MSYYKPIHLNLHPSPVLAWVLGLAGLISCTLLVFLPIDMGIKVLIMVLTVIASVYSIQRYALISLARSITHLSLNPEAKLQLTFKNGTTHEVKALESSFVAAYLTILNMQSLESKQRMHLILLSDNVEPESFRQLRVWLRWGREQNNTRG